MMRPLSMMLHCHRDPCCHRGSRGSRASRASRASRGCVAPVTVVAPVVSPPQHLAHSGVPRQVLLTMMRSGGLPVDVVMYNLLMTAYKKKRQWFAAHAVLQQMVQVCAHALSPCVAHGIHAHPVWHMHCHPVWHMAYMHTLCGTCTVTPGCAALLCATRACSVALRACRAALTCAAPPPLAYIPGSSALHVLTPARPHPCTSLPLHMSPPLLPTLLR